MPSKLFQSTPAAAPVLPANPVPKACLLAVFALPINDIPSGNVDFAGIPGVGFRVVDVEIVKQGGAGGALDTHQLQTAAGVAISDLISTNIPDTTTTRAASIAPATWDVAAGGGLRVAVNDGGAGNTACTVYVSVLLSPAGGAEAHQASPAVAGVLGPGSLPAPSFEIVVPLSIPAAKGTSDWGGRAGQGFYITDVWFIKTDAVVGVNPTSLTLNDENGNPITDALAIGTTAIGTIVRLGLAPGLNYNNNLIVPGGGLQVVTASGGAPDCRGLLLVRGAHT